MHGKPSALSSVLFLKTNQLPVCWYFTWLWRNVRFIVSRLGLEPRTHSLEGCCSIQLNYRDMFWCCVPTWTRTKDPRIKNPLLYPSELSGHILSLWVWVDSNDQSQRERIYSPCGYQLPVTHPNMKKRNIAERSDSNGNLPPRGSDQLNYVHDKITFCAIADALFHLSTSSSAFVKTTQSHLWILVDSNHVLWIFSPAHIPYLPRIRVVGCRDGIEPSASQSQCDMLTNCTNATIWRSFLPLTTKND